MLYKLCGFVVNNALNVLGDKAVDQLQAWIQDPKQEFAQALDQANARTWRVLELAVAGNSMGQWLRQRLITGAERGVLAPVQIWMHEQGEEFRLACAAELCTMRSQQRLTLDISPAGGRHLIAAYTQVPGSEAALANALSTEIQAEFPNLSRFVAEYDNQWLPQTFRYFLKHAVATRPLLRDMLQFKALERLQDTQVQGFSALEQMLTEQGAAIETELQHFGSSIAELQRINAESLAILQAIYTKLSNSHRQGPISPRLSSMLRSSSDVELLQILEQRLQALPAGQLSVEVLDAIGRLAVAVGKFAAGQQYFQQAATVAQAGGQLAAEAQAQYNQYRALLEQQQWDVALAILLQAAKLDPQNLRPFPLDKFQTKRILGAGGFGVAFECYHTWLKYPVVIKTLYREELERDIAEIFREGAILRNIHHPGIIGITDCDYADVAQTRPYLVMEYFPGESLESYLAQHGALSIPQTLVLAKLMAEALHTAHQQGIWHRDVKPDNVLIRMQDSQLQIKLIDFGLAVSGQRVVKTVLSGLANQSILGTSLGGTFQYSAPEQLGNLKAAVGPWSDVYAFGKTLSKALFLTSAPSFDDYIGLGGHALAKLIGGCIVEDPKKRLQDFAVVLEQLNRVTLDNPVFKI
ncbi:hypothetical protein TI04_03080 [Achromatium sp. WMS2]|nr:hypothetical protein TI04_03080 [Achromatium sp. WMS2]